MSIQHNRQKNKLDGNWCLRPDYISRSESATLEKEEMGSYWTPERLAASLSYQYDVYRIAYKLAARVKGVASILDVGCGPARKHSLFSDVTRNEITLVDQQSVKEVASRYLPSAEFHSVDLETANLDLQKKFDIVVCADVVEHLVDPNACIAFIKRHTKKDGFSLISTPDRERLYGPEQITSGHPCHVREWSFSEFAAFIHERDLKIVRHIILGQQKTSAPKWGIKTELEMLGVRDPDFSCQLAICSVK